MPVCFQLFAIGFDEPVDLIKVDEEMCAHFGVPCDPKRYLGGWFDAIGFRIAMGDGYAEIRSEFENTKPEDESHAMFLKNILDILEYLEERYTYDNWRESSSYPKENR